VFAALPTLGLIAGPSYAALVFGLGVVQLAYGVAAQRRLPAFDRELAVLAAAFAVLALASAAWSIRPQHSLAAALQVAAIFAGGLVFLAAPPPDRVAARRLYRVLMVATAAGAALIVADRALDYPLQALLTGRPAPGVATKYNRGEDYLVLLAWPQLAFATWRRSWRDVAVLVVCLVLVVATGRSLAGLVAALTGAAALALAWYLPRLAVALLAAVALLLAVGVPSWMQVVTARHDLLAPLLKPSALHRLEIWDYTTSHVFRRPFLGWGIATADLVPMSQVELSQYAMRPGTELYPHNQWLELWVETGALGAAIGLAFALLLLRRISRLAAPLRPFACAAFASGVVVSCVNFEVTTDSWWAALAASGWLLIVLQRQGAP
jgi:hypothetical protein